MLVHASLRNVGKVMGGAQSILDALRDAVGPDGTILGYTDWDGQDDVEDHPELREHARPFDPLTSRSIRDVPFEPWRGIDQRCKPEATGHSPIGKAFG